MDLYNERIMPCGARMCYVPQFAHEHVEWGFQDQSLRFFVDRKVVQVSEAASVRCLVFCDSDTLVTGSDDNLVSLWRLSHGSTNTPVTPGTVPNSRLSLDHVMRGHAEAVTCIAASRPWSLIVSGSEDKSAILWDLNRAQYVRTIRHETAVHAVAISDSEVRVLQPCVDEHDLESSIFSGTYRNCFTGSTGDSYVERTIDSIIAIIGSRPDPHAGFP